MEIKISDFEKKINIDFNNKALIQKAFIHRSFVNEKKGKGLEHNERMEFLGDAVLELSATKFLYKNFPKKKEGEMTSIRSSLVSTDSLALKGKELGLGDYLFLSKGEKTSDKGRDHLIANTFEAIIGAIYLDKGFSEADKFIKKYLLCYIDEILEKNLYIDPKSYFQEKAQEFQKFTPEYRLIYFEGPDHNRYFVMGVYLGEEKIAEGRGASKQKAEVEAAKNGLEIKKWN